VRVRERRALGGREPGPRHPRPAGPRAGDARPGPVPSAPRDAEGACRRRAHIRSTHEHGGPGDACAP
jgi:hypothetical protein